MLKGVWGLYSVWCICWYVEYRYDVEADNIKEAREKAEQYYIGEADVYELDFTIEDIAEIKTNKMEDK